MPTIKCTYYRAITEDTATEGFFKKRCFQPVNKKLPVFIEYEGDAEKFPPPKHGNSRKPGQASGFTRTLPSMMAELNIRLETQKPAEVYRALTNAEKVRNKKVCSNIRSVNLIQLNLFQLYLTLIKFYSINLRKSTKNPL